MIEVEWIIVIDKQYVTTTKKEHYRSPECSPDVFKTYSVLLGNKQRKWIYNNNKQGMFYLNCKFDHSEAGALVQCIGRDHYGNKVQNT